MKEPNRQWSVRLKAVLLSLCFASGVNASEIRNGGDILIVGDAAFTLDEVEFSSAFVPQQDAEAWSILDQQLKKLSTKLPRTESYLRSMFERGRIVWNFSKAKLKPVDDEGHTNLLLTGEKQQLAINSGSLVQIWEDGWKALKSPTSRAIVLLHEALWIANGKRALNDGEAVRKLIALLMDPSLDQHATVNIVANLNGIFEGDATSSAFYNQYNYEFQSRGDYRNFEPAFVFTKETDDLILHSKLKLPNLPKYDGLLISALNPNPSYDSLSVKKGLFYGSRAGRPYPLKKNDKDLCGDLDYALHKTGWRLPTSKELYALEDNQIRRLNYFVPQRYPYIALSSQAYHIIDGFLRSTDEGAKAIIPSTADGKDVILLSQENKLLNLNGGLNEVRRPTDGDLEIFYLCVHDKVTGEGETP